ncbi:MAG: PQQ-like beta-propeller repeat protein [Planctomycetota bacterium]|nr:PQQ-like beta-propeller repeat protein [Planctomycetota bacterium]MDA1179186.1 PQQ-like beta-propeller repeat protein [Planctomycetota bacterium]
MTQSLFSRTYFIRSMKTFLFLLIPIAAEAADWPHWRGPEQNGVSREKNLPDHWTLKGENLVWRKTEFATRSTPIVMDGRVYVICRAFPETTQEGEKVACIHAETGELLWEAVNNVFLSDAPAERVGWSSAVGDPATGHVYSLGLGCLFQCLNAKTGQQVWSHSMSEEYGMLSTYGGRTNLPIVFEDLVIISGVMTGWGDYAVPAHRLVAFDKLTGVPVWIASTRVRPEDTTYSTPFITTLNGQAAMVFGASDGSVYALQPRTGQVIWKYDASPRGINTMPLVHDSMIFCGHSEQNSSDTTILGAMFAFDGRTQGNIAEKSLTWKIPARTVGRCQPMWIDGRIYAVDDGGTLWIVDAKTGKEIAKKKLGRIMFGSMVYGDGKIFVGEATGRWYVLRPTEQGVDVVHQLRLNSEEILGSPTIANGRIYLPTNVALYCIGNKSPIVEHTDSPKSLPESPVRNDQKITQLQLVPVELLVKSSEKQKLTVRGFNALGQYVQDVKAELSVDGAGTVDQAGIFHAPAETVASVAKITASAGGLACSNRVRIVPPLPWKFDFSNNQVPATWIGASYRHQPKLLEKEPVLVKISTIPKGTRSQSWMGSSSMSGYTVQADVMATDRAGQLPDMGVINQRYTLAMLASQELQLRSWTSRLQLRFAETVPFVWKSGTWYRMKLRAENVSEGVQLSGKVWPREGAEPSMWMIQATDKTPNVTGSPGLFGNATDAEFYVDNVEVTPNP